MVLDVLVSSKQCNKARKGIHIRKEEIQQSLFVDDMIVQKIPRNLRNSKTKKPYYN